MVTTDHTFKMTFLCRHLLDSDISTRILCLGFLELFLIFIVLQINQLETWTTRYVTSSPHHLINLQLFAEAPSRNISGAETQELPINDPASHHLQLDGWRILSSVKSVTPDWGQHTNREVSIGRSNPKYITNLVLLLRIQNLILENKFCLYPFICFMSF